CDGLPRRAAIDHWLHCGGVRDGLFCRQPARGRQRRDHGVIRRFLMQAERTRQAFAAFQAFLSTPLDAVLSRHTDTSPEQSALELFSTVVDSVPAYRAFLAEHGIDPSNIQTFDDFQKLPQTNKKNYQLRYPLGELCRDGRLESCDFIAVSS